MSHTQIHKYKYKYIYIEIQIHHLKGKIEVLKMCTNETCYDKAPHVPFLLLSVLILISLSFQAGDCGGESAEQGEGSAILESESEI